MTDLSSDCSFRKGNTSVAKKKSSNVLSENKSALSFLSPDELCILYDAFFFKTKTRKDVLAFESFIKNMPTAFNECPYPLFHSFADGMYTREIHIKAGDLVVGEIHKSEYFINVLKGRLWVVSEFGAKEIIAPCQFKAKAGVKHIVFTIEDTVWSDTHKTDKTTVKEAEADIFVSSYDDFDACKKIHEVLGLDESDEALLYYEHIDDLIDQPEDYIEIKTSTIDGLGVFTQKDLRVGDRVTARISNNRTPVGRYTNHADIPNSIAMIEGGIAFYSIVMDIKKDSELTVNYGDVRVKSKMLDRYMSCQGL